MTCDKEFDRISISESAEQGNKAFTKGTRSVEQTGNAENDIKSKYKTKTRKSVLKFISKFFSYR